MATSSDQPSIVSPIRAPTSYVKCRLCQISLGGPGTGDLRSLGFCADCKTRPEARRLSAVKVHESGPRAFSVAEQALIRKVHGYMPAQDLLELLNERLVSDLGPDAARHTIEQLHAEIQQAAPDATTDPNDRAELRRLLAQARRSGVLATIDAQCIEDFAVVFSLSLAQLLRLKDIVLPAATEESA